MHAHIPIPHIHIYIYIYVCMYIHTWHISFLCTPKSMQTPYFYSCQGSPVNEPAPPNPLWKPTFLLNLADLYFPGILDRGDSSQEALPRHEGLLQERFLKVICERDVGGMFPHPPALLQVSRWIPEPPGRGIWVGSGWVSRSPSTRRPHNHGQPSRGCAGRVTGGPRCCPVVLCPAVTHRRQCPRTGSPPGGPGAPGPGREATRRPPH